MNDVIKPTTAIKDDYIDIRDVWNGMKKYKKYYFIFVPITILLSSLLILCVPRTYTSSEALAPELDNGNGPSGGTLGALASSMGFDLGNMTSSDAINPTLYPSLMDDNGFVASLFNIKVKTLDGTLSTTYYDYLKKHQKRTWWSSATIIIKKAIIPKKSNPGHGGGKGFDPYNLSEVDDALVNSIRDKITIDIDKKTDVIDITAKAQDPLVCKILCDSITLRLQNYITDYRTRKARNDYEYYKSLSDKAKTEYERSRQRYANSADANTDLVLTSYQSKVEDLENDMQLKYNTYSAMQTQVQAARAKVLERTPAFTILKGSAVPIKASGPKRMIFVLAMTFLSFVIITMYVIKRIAFSDSKQHASNADQ